MTKTTSQNGIDLIKKFEGCCLTAYKCPAGIWTIGFGHTSGVTSGMTITQAQAENYLKQDLKQFETVVNSSVKVEINQNQFDALISFTYNVGAGSLKSSTLLKLLNNGNYNGAAAQFDRFIYASGVKLDGLVKRRTAEKELFLKNSGMGLNKKVKVTASVLNIRAGAGTSYKITGTLQKNAIVILTDTSNGWGKLSDGRGWIALNYTISL